MSGGPGLIVDANGIQLGGPDGTQQPGATKPPLNVLNRGRSAQLDALEFYVATGVKSPNAPYAAVSPSTALGVQIARGRELFAANNCASCHGGGGWASGRFNRLPAVPTIALDQGVAVTQDVLRDVGTFAIASPNEIKANGTPGAGALGFNPPSLLGAFALAPYLHNGSAQTLDEVMALVPHRSSGTGGADQLGSVDDRNALVAFLKSIDPSTPAFAIP